MKEPRAETDSESVSIAIRLDAILVLDEALLRSQCTGADIDAGFVFAAVWIRVQELRVCQNTWIKFDGVEVVHPHLSMLNDHPFRF